VESEIKTLISPKTNRKADGLNISFCQSGVTGVRNKFSSVSSRLSASRAILFKFTLIFMRKFIGDCATF